MATKSSRTQSQEGSPHPNGCWVTSTDFNGMLELSIHSGLCNSFVSLMVRIYSVMVYFIERIDSFYSPQSQYSSVHAYCALCIAFGKQRNSMQLLVRGMDAIHLSDVVLASCFIGDVCNSDNTGLVL